MENLKNLETLTQYYENLGARPRESFEFLLSKLGAAGFADDIKDLDLFLSKNPTFMGKCNTVNDALVCNNYCIVITNDALFNARLYSFFPVLYAINSRGKSVFRITAKGIIDRTLKQDSECDVLYHMKKNFLLINNFIGGDSRLISFSASIEGMLTELMDGSRSILFTMVTSATDEATAKKDIMHRIELIYGYNIMGIFKQSIHPVFIPKENVASLWD